MLKINKLFPVVFMVLYASSGHAMTAYELNQQYCNGDERQQDFCTGYISGIADILSSLVVDKTLPATTCPPRGEKTGQLLRAFQNYLAQHDDRINQEADRVIKASFEAAFPCHLKRK